MEGMIKMDFFDKLGKKASEAYKVTADKTGKLAKEAKLRLKMNELKSQINDIYKEIGEKVYQKHISEEEKDITEEIKEKCTNIDVISAEIESIQKECLQLKDKKLCSNCFKEIEKNVKFCPSCGAKQEEIEEKDNLETTVEVESNPKLDNSETIQEISYTQADEVEKQ